MAGLDAVTEYRVQGVPVGGGLVLAGSDVIADAAGGLGTKFLGTMLGRAASALAQAVAAYAIRLPAVERFVGMSTADLVAMKMVEKALDSALGIRGTVRGLLASAGIPALAAGGSLGQQRAQVTLPAAAQQRVFRTDVARKATLTRL